MGVWGDIYRVLGQYQQRSRKGRKRQLRFFRRFREAANSVPDALVVLDKTSRIEWSNPAAQVLMDLHWPRDNGKPLVNCFPHPELSEYIKAGEYHRPLEVAPAHNRSIMLSIRVAPFGERKKQRLVVGRDITKVFHLNMIRREFVANASHELRTPLTVISGFLETLVESSQTPSSQRRPLNLMQNQAERMRRIIEDLLTLSRLEMDRHASGEAVVDVPCELEQIVADAYALSGGRHGFTIDIDTDLMLYGKDSELRSAFSNILFNAIKHTPPGTQVELTWSRTEDGPIFAVKDDGPGVEARHIPRLTERFYRVDKARSRESGGTGLGLAIVKHVLNRHDARLAVASEPGQGAIFTCHFPPEREVSPASGVRKRAPAETEPEDKAEIEAESERLLADS
jgi:two-component system phosphate regulon sensor histidine kinase PhoR